MTGIPSAKTRPATDATLVHEAQPPAAQAPVCGEKPTVAARFPTPAQADTSNVTLSGGRHAITIALVISAQDTGKAACAFSAQNAKASASAQCAQPPEAATQTLKSGRITAAPPAPGELPHIPDLLCRQLAEPDADAILTLQAEMLAALPARSWYYPSPRALFAACCRRGEAYGFFDGALLAGFGVLTPWHIRPDTCYACKIGDPPDATFDFQDVMVAPGYRRRGIHTALLRLFEGMARKAGGKAIYCTIAPENLPSVASFEKAGYVCVRRQPAYEGMLRGYYRKTL